MSIDTNSHGADVRDGDTVDTERRRITAVSAVLAVSGPLGIVLYLLWPSNSGADGTFLLSDFDTGRGMWWWLVNGGAVLTVVIAIAQSIATLAIVRTGGARWAEWGVGLLLVGTAVQAVGLGGVAAAYYWASDPTLGTSVGDAAFAAVNGDQGHLFGALLCGELTATIGAVLLAVALLRSGAVPKWVPIAQLFTVLSIIAPVEQISTLVFSVPIAAGAVGLAYYAHQSVTRADAR